MNCFAITTSYLQTKIRVIHIFQTRDFVNIGFSEITVNDHIMTFSDSNCNTMFVIQKFYLSLCEIFSENAR